MQLTSLPRDLLENILSKVPDTPLARFRTTSKRWNIMLSSESFVKKHSANAPKDESLCITLMNSRVHLVRINLHDPSVKVATHPFYLKDPLSNSSQVDIRNVSRCDGLLLCSTEDDRLVVWDPYSGETKWIKPRDRYKDTDYFALGFDNKSSCKQYKILRVDRNHILPVCEVYDFTSDSWRVLGTATDWYLPDYCHGISMKGNTYWLAMRMWLMGEDESSSELQVWVTTSTGSWNKSLAVIGLDGYRDMLKDMIPRGISFLADEQKKVVMCLNRENNFNILRENKHILKEHLGGGSKCISSPAVLMNYPPSLARIRQGTFLGDAKGKRKACDL
uniref:F-box domain-containing protein n=1 Tax=Brassica campestris TaxID=3711 RepID=M4CCH8_BRACM